MAVYERELHVGHAVGRVFAREERLLTDEAVEAAFCEQFEDEDDRARHDLLVDLVSGRNACTWQALITAHQGVDPSDVWHLFLGPTPDEAVFACVIVPPHHVERALQSAPVFFESATVQVASTAVPHLLDGCRAWARRVLPPLTERSLRLLTRPTRSTRALGGCPPGQRMP